LTSYFADSNLQSSRIALIGTTSKNTVTRIHNFARLSNSDRFLMAHSALPFQ